MTWNWQIGSLGSARILTPKLEPHDAHTSHYTPSRMQIASEILGEIDPAQASFGLGSWGSWGSLGSLGSCKCWSYRVLELVNLRSCIYKGQLRRGLRGSEYFCTHTKTSKVWITQGEVKSIGDISNQEIRLLVSQSMFFCSSTKAKMMMHIRMPTTELIRYINIHVTATWKTTNIGCRQEISDEHSHIWMHTT